MLTDAVVPVLELLLQKVFRKISNPLQFLWKHVDGPIAPDRASLGINIPCIERGCSFVRESGLAKSLRRFLRQNATGSTNRFYSSANVPGKMSAAVSVPEGVLT
jgi:hypothetical protein